MINNDNSPLPKSVLDFLDVTNQTQLVAPSTSSTGNKPPVIDFVKICETLWQAKGQVNYYQKGLFLGRGDNSNIMFSEFLKKFRKTLEEITREELRINNQTSESFKDEFKALESLFNIITTHLQLLKVDIKDTCFMPILHGFINAYINSITNVERNV